jgi:purine-binding chemotaxis protein CheW
LETMHREDASGTASSIGRPLALLVRTGEHTCALPIENVVETMRPLPIEPVAGMPLFVRGLTIIRGTPVPVVALSTLLGAGQESDSQRYVLLRTDNRYVALTVQEVLGIRELEPLLLRAWPPLLGEAHADLIAALGTLDQRLLLVLQTARIVPDAVWQVLAASDTRPC